MFDSWDFSLEGGWTLICDGATLLTATKSNFAEGSNGIDLLVAVAPCGGVTVTYSKLDQKDLQNLNGSLIFIALTGPGTFTAMYNELDNSTQDVIDIGPTTDVIKYNLIYGNAVNLHGDWVQTGSGLFNIDTEFNTVNSTNTGVGSQGYGYGFNSGGNIGNSTLAFNTTIGNNVNYQFQVDSSQTSGAVTVHDNYSDTTGAAFGFGPLGFARHGSACNPCGGGGTSIFSHNVNMVNGTLYTNNP